MKLYEKNKINLEYLLELALQATREAGEAIKNIYLRDFTVEWKDDGSPLTLADKRSSEIIAGRLSETGLLIVDEEGKENHYEIRKDQEYFWLVDPLDGTKEFINKNGEFTVNIALIHKDRPVLGVIYAPIKDCMYYALKGKGAYKIENGVEIGLTLESQTLSNNGKITVAGSRSHSNEELNNFLVVLKEKFEKVEFISAGSSLKFGLVAEGEAQIYPRTTPTMEWDTAAGQIIAEESNGEVVGWNSREPLTYNKKDLRNSWFIVYRNEMEGWIKELV